MPSDCTWVGGATAVAQVDTVTPANVEIGDIFTITVYNQSGTKSKAITWTATAATVKNVCDNLTSLWNASIHPLCTGVTATDDDAVITLTADTAGVPFTITCTATNGGAADTQTLTRAASVANVGPNDFASADNWSTGTVPANGDSVFINNSTYDILYSLNQSAKTFAQVDIESSFSAKIGLQGILDGAHLRCDITTLNIGDDLGPVIGPGSPRIKLHGTITTANIYSTSSTAEEPYLSPVRIKGTVTTANVLRGIVGFAANEEADTCSITTLNMGYIGDKDGDAAVVMGHGTTVTTITKTGGHCVCSSNNGITTVTNSGGTFDKYGSGAITTLNARDGNVSVNDTGAVTTANVTNATYVSNSTGTITTMNILTTSSSTIDFTQNNAARTLTTLNFDSAMTLGATCTILYNPALTLTNEISLTRNTQIQSSAL